MTDASREAVKAVLGKKKDGKVIMIHYASRTVNVALMKYSIAVKE